MRYSKRLHYRISNGRLTPFVANAMALSCWVLTAFLLPDRGTEAMEMWLNRGAGFLLCLLTGYVLIVINNLFAIVRTRTSMQASLYILLVAATPPLHGAMAAHLATLCQLTAFGFLFASYQRPAAVSRLFYAFIFLGLGSMLLPSVMLLLPFYWLGAYMLQALSARSFYASVVGFLLPYWFLWSHAYYHDSMELFYRPFIALSHFDALSLSHYEPWLVATLAYVGILYLMGSMHYQQRSHEDKLRTRGFLQFLLFHSLLLLFYIALQPIVGEAFLPLLYSCISLLVSHCFVLTNSRATNLFFILTAVCWLLLYAYNLWTAL